MGCKLGRSGQYDMQGSSGSSAPTDRRTEKAGGGKEAAGGGGAVRLPNLFRDPVFDVVGLDAAKPSQFVVGCDDGSITLLDWRAPEGVQRWSAHSKSVNRLAFAPSRRLLASCSRDATVKLWELGKTEALQTLKGHSLTVSSVDFSGGAMVGCL